MLFYGFLLLITNWLKKRTSDCSFAIGNGLINEIRATYSQNRLIK